MQGSAPVKLDKLTGTDGFVVTDLNDATTSVGIARLAPKVLREGVELLARSVTYAFASFGVAGHGGASGAINAKPEARDDAVAAFVDEMREPAEARRLVLAPGTGLTSADLAPLGWREPDAALTAAGALAAARVAGPTDWRTAAVVGTGPVCEAATAQLGEAGAALAEPRLDAECDVLFVAGKAGVLDHTAAEAVRARTIVPLAPVPVTARALAVLRKADQVVIPDFLSTAGPLLATYAPEGGDPLERIHGAVTDLAEDGTGLWLAAALRAEENLAAWTNEKPFGRPLA
jgi:Glutamate/Leucine/Phenylalanine/Valine dehydrogenase